MVTREKLRQIVFRIEKLEKEKTEILEDIKSVYSDAKSDHFDVQALKKVIKERRIGKEKVDEQMEVVEQYRSMLENVD